MAARCATEPFDTTCAVYVDCEGWWLSWFGGQRMGTSSQKLRIQFPASANFLLYSSLPHSSKHVLTDADMFLKETKAMKNVIWCL